MISLDRQTFHNWLRSLPPDKPFATRGCITTCPIGAYLRAHKAPDPLVLYDEISLDRYGDLSLSNLPAWVPKFIAAADKSGDPYTDMFPHQAVKILDAIR